MGREDEIVKERKKKISELWRQGINPYPHKFDKKHNAGDLQEKYRKLKKEEFGGMARIAGRIISLRNLGKIAFARLQDTQGGIQLVFQDDKTPKKVFEFFNQFIDAGDFVGVVGKVFRTKRGELSILIKKLELLSKSLKPLPSKWHGLKDKEERYRRRYLDLILNPEVKRVFETRTRVINLLRDFLNKKGFIEVDVPILQPLYGGGAARPFVTELNALKIKIFLAISNELYLKRLNVGAFEKVYSMNRVFRNEGIDATHNPEFTILETMWAYKDYTANMDLFEEMVEIISMKVLGKTKINYQGKDIELARPWVRMSMSDAIKKFAKIDVGKMSDDELKKFVKDAGIKLDSFRRGLAIEEIFEEFCEDKLIQPTIIYDYPADTSPLAKKKEGTDLCERFEVYINGWEMGNNYTELNDPEELKRVFSEQAEFKKRGDVDAAPYDNDFVNALEIGMPPTSGLGLGVDRFIMLLTDQPSIRDVILFPFMKPEKNGISK